METTSRLRKQYTEEIVPALMKQFDYKSVMQVPQITKIAINQGISAALTDKKLIDTGIVEMSAITGQKAVPTISKRDVSNFKLRKGNPIGVRVTLRGVKMYEFLDRLISVALPRVRDFRGISDKGFDGRGNYSFGVSSFPIVQMRVSLPVGAGKLFGVPRGVADEDSFLPKRGLWRFSRNR